MRATTPTALLRFRFQSHARCLPKSHLSPIPPPPSLTRRLHSWQTPRVPLLAVRSFSSTRSLKAVTQGGRKANKKSSSVGSELFDLLEENDVKVIKAVRKLVNVNEKDGGGGKDKEMEKLKGCLGRLEEAEKSHLSLLSVARKDPDAELRSLAVQELPSSESTLLRHFSRLRRTFFSLSIFNSQDSQSLLHQAPALIEIQHAVGGTESGLFVNDLLGMYEALCDRLGWKCLVVNKVETDAGGIREVLIEVNGSPAISIEDDGDGESGGGEVKGGVLDRLGPYGRLRREAGVHRVQRIPSTEKMGRIHTSTAAVIVLPVLESSEATNDLIDEKDLKVETMRAKGAGGQHVNRTESAIRLTHIPTGIVVSMQDSRSQHQNKDKALQVLRARLMDRKLAEDEEAKRKERRNQVKSASRSDKIKTYNWPENRLTDHRIPLTMSCLSDALKGGKSLDNFAEVLEEKEEEEKVEGVLMG